MRFSIIAATVLAGSANTLKVLEHDKLAARGLENVAEDVTKHGYPRPGTCTLENASRRREWYVPFKNSTNPSLSFDQVTSLQR